MAVLAAGMALPGSGQWYLGVGETVVVTAKRLDGIMVIELEKRGRFLILLGGFAILLLTCSEKAESEEEEPFLSVKLIQVMTNVPIQDSLSNIVFPEVYFGLVFQNISSNHLFLKLDDHINGLEVILSCPNGENIKLPLYENTTVSLDLSPQEEKYKSFKLDSRELQEALVLCSNNGTGNLIKEITSEVVILIRQDKKKITFNCNRMEFESPEYFISE